MRAIGTSGTPVKYLAREVKDLNLSLEERNLLSLSYGRIIRKDIESNEGLLPANFERYTVVRPGDVVLRLTDLQNDQRSLRTGLVNEPGIITSAYLTLRPQPTVDSRYLAYALHAVDLAKVFYTLGGGLRQSMGMEEVGGLRLALPPLEEQRRIADFLDDQVSRIAALCVARGEQQAKIWSAAYSELHTLVMPTDGTVVPLCRLIGSERLGIWGDEPVPGVDEVLVARVADFDRPIFRLGEVETVRSVEPGAYASRALRPGDILLERSGGTAKNPVGCAVLVEEVGTRMVCSNFVSRVRAAHGINSNYLSLVLGAKYANGEQRPHSNQTTGIQNLDTESYFSSRVPVALGEQQAHLARSGEDLLANTRGAANSLAESVASLRSLQQSLVTAAVTGELDVTTARRGIPA